MRAGRHDERAYAAAGVTVKRTRRHTQYCELSNLTGAQSFDGEPTHSVGVIVRWGVCVAFDVDGRKTTFEPRNLGSECAKRNRQLFRRVIYRLTFICYYLLHRSPASESHLSIATNNRAHTYIYIHIDIVITEYVRQTFLLVFFFFFYHRALVVPKRARDCADDKRY